MTRDPRARFSDRVADYVAARPGYPPAVVDAMLEIGAHNTRLPIADVGAGTGLMTRLLHARGLRVVGVEPNAAMREASELPMVDGSAERTGLDDASVGGIVAAQAFHWFDRGAIVTEWRRILRPGGWVALVWNRRHKTGDAFSEGYEALLVRHGTDYGRVDHTQITAEQIAEFFGHPVRRRLFDNSQRFDLSGLTARLLSSSYAPAAGEPGHEAMMLALRELFARCEREGRVTMRYETELYVGRF